MKTKEKLGLLYGRYGRKMERGLLAAFLVCTLLAFNKVWVAVLTVGALLWHEGGHLLMLWWLRRRVGGVRLSAEGLRIRTGALSYREEILVALAGPLANLLGALLALLLRFAGQCATRAMRLPLGGAANDGSVGRWAAYLLTLALLHLLCALSNLLPVGGRDGERILRALVDLWGRGAWLLRPLFAFSFFLEFLLCFVSLWLVWRIGEGYAVGATFLCAVLTSLRQGKNAQKTRISEHLGDFRRY